MHLDGVAPAVALVHARALLATAPDTAERQAREVLRVLPDDARAVAIIGSARRRQGDMQAARELLSLVATRRPDMTHACQEFAEVQAALGQTDAALAVLRQSARHGGMDWQRAADAFLLAAEDEAALRADAEFVRGLARPADMDLIAGADALRMGRPADAAVLLRGHLGRAPADGLALALLAGAALALGHREDAEAFAAGAVGARPDLPPLRILRARILLARNKPHDALDGIAALPATAGLRRLRALCALLGARYAEAADIARGLTGEHPGVASVWLLHGQVQRALGDTAAARAAFRAAIALRPDLGEPWWCLADMRDEAPQAADRAAMRAVLAAAPRARDRMYLSYALGRAAETAGDAAEAIGMYGAAASLAGGAAPAQPDARDAIHRLFTPAFVAARACGGAEGAPIFIVGLPRSGSTLVERILASHSQVVAGGELPELGHIVNALGRDGRTRTGPGLLAHIAALDYRARVALGREYMARAARYLPEGASRFTDKTGDNYLSIGLIRLILPRARIVDVRRNPMAAGLSIYRQHLRGAPAYATDLGRIGARYRTYLDIMRHYDAVFPGAVHRLVYDDLIADPEREIDRLLAYCGLTPEQRCWRHWENDMPAATHSAEQIRLPLFTEGVHNWRTYDAHLAALRAALGAAVDTWRD